MFLLLFLFQIIPARGWAYSASVGQATISAMAEFVSASTILYVAPALTQTVSWSSSDATVATISMTSGSQGLASALAPGSCVIGANMAGVTGTAAFFVMPTN
jgi:hypothetical protein